MDIEKEVRFFDQFEAEHGEYDVLTEQAYRRLLTTLERRVRPTAGMRAIDLGCGTGAFTHRLQRFGLELTGVDISPRSIARARETHGGTFLVGDINATTLEACSFEIAVMSGVLHHIPTSAGRVGSLREAFRLLKPGGHFFSYDPNGHSPSMFLYRDPRSPLHTTAGKTDNEVLLTRRQMIAELTAAGFTGVHVIGLSGITYRYVEGAIAARLLPFYNHIYENVMRLPILQSVMGTFLIATATRP